MVWQGVKGKGVEKHLTSDLFVRVVYFWLRLQMRDPSRKLQETIITRLRDCRRSTCCEQGWLAYLPLPSVDLSIDVAISLRSSRLDLVVHTQQHLFGSLKPCAMLRAIVNSVCKDDRIFNTKINWRRRDNTRSHKACWHERSAFTSYIVNWIMNVKFMTSHWY